MAPLKRSRAALSRQGEDEISEVVEAHASLANDVQPVTALNMLGKMSDG
jgi:hypothetical protein